MKATKSKQSRRNIRPTEIPKPLFALVDWHARWHYPKQVDFVDAQKDYYEVVFKAGNGTGKTHMLYWSALTLALGIHPHQFAEPPLKIKVLITDFEHGYGKIFTETCLKEIYLPKRYEVWRTDQQFDSFSYFHCEYEEAEKYILSHPEYSYEIVTVPEFTMPPMLDKAMIKSEPSRDDRTLALTNGSFLFFQTSEQRKKLHSGTNFDILLLDEEHQYQIYDESKRGLRTAKGGGKILHAFTPPFDEEDKQKGPSWTKFKLIDPFERGEFKKDEKYDLCVVSAAMNENPSITKDYIRKFSKGKTEQQIKIQIYGQYPTYGKMVFGDFLDAPWNPQTRTGHILPNDFEVPFDDPDVLFEMAVDWHASKPAAVLWTFEWQSGPNKGDVVVYDELSPNQTEGLTITGLKLAIREAEGWRRMKIRRYGDPKMKDKSNALISGFNAWDEFRHGEPKIFLTEAWNRDPATGYSIVNDFLRGKTRENEYHPRVFIRENCKTLINNMKNHYWVIDKHGIGTPDPKFSDYCVNLKYILQTKARKVRNKDKLLSTQSRWPITSLGNNPAMYGNYVAGHFN